MAGDLVEVGEAFDLGLGGHERGLGDLHVDPVAGALVVLDDDIVTEGRAEGAFQLRPPFVVDRRYGLGLDQELVPALAEALDRGVGESDLADGRADLCVVYVAGEAGDDVRAAGEVDAVLRSGNEEQDGARGADHERDGSEDEALAEEVVLLGGHSCRLRC